MNRVELSGVYAISGGLGGLGSVSARMILRSGGEVVLTGRRRPAEVEDELARLADAAGCDRGRISYARVQGADVAQYAEVFEGVRIRGAVLSAATVTAGHILEVSTRTLIDTFTVNALGAFAFAQAAARRMRDHGEGGGIVAFSSIASRRPQPGNSVYGATKSALEAFMRYMAIELGEYNIRANTIAIGTVGEEGMAARHMVENPEFARRIISAMPMRRLGTADEFGRVVAWLMSDDAEYINGAEIAFDGGSRLSPSYAR